MYIYGCAPWHLNDKNIEAFRIAGRKIKRQILKLPARLIIIFMWLARMIKLMYIVLNHYKKICRNLFHTKFSRTRSTFSKNYQYLSYKYKLSDRDGYNDLEHSLGKV